MGVYVFFIIVVVRLIKVILLKVEFVVLECYVWEIKKGINLEFKVEGKLDIYYVQVYVIEFSIDMEIYLLNICVIYFNCNGELLVGRYVDI